jgi:hypothetical protein
MTPEQELQALNTLCQECELNIVNCSIELHRTKNREIKADLKGWIKRDVENLMKWRQQRADKLNIESILKWQQEKADRVMLNSPYYKTGGSYNPHCPPSRLDGTAIIPCSNTLFVNGGAA